LVRDEDGRKMSKSTGNVIDPLEMIEEHGADALRFTLAIFAAMGRDIKLSVARIQGYRHFINKIWNAARFGLMNLDRVPELDEGARLSFSHRFILSDLERVKEEVARGLEEYRFNDAAQELYQFLWHTYCDWYLEMIKPELFSEDDTVRGAAQACLHRTLTELLTVLHPFIPFVTQEIWSFLPSIEEPNLARVPYPEARPERKDEKLAGDMAFFQEVVVSVRNIRSELNINPGQKLDLLIKASGHEAGLLEENREVLCQLARLQRLELDPSLAPPPASASNVVRGCELYVPLEGIIDFEAESQRMEKQLQKLDKEKGGLEKKLSNEDFVNKAPAEVVAKERDRLEELKAKQEKLSLLRQKLQAYLGEVS
jgi:valyl-tRNA synthetase